MQASSRSLGLLSSPNSMRRCYRTVQDCLLTRFWRLNILWDLVGSRITSPSSRHCRQKSEKGEYIMQLFFLPQVLFCSVEGSGRVENLNKWALPLGWKVSFENEGRSSLRHHPRLGFKRGSQEKVSMLSNYFSSHRYFFAASKSWGCMTI